MSRDQSDDRRTVERLYKLFEPPRLRLVPVAPTARQEAFLMLHAFEVFFGGAAAGGKTAALLMAALQYADVPGYHALIVRKTLAELRLPGNLIELSHDWLAQTKAVWSSDQNMWRFPARNRTGAGGATLSFGYLADDTDVSRYHGSSFSYLAFDELTGFPENYYRRMHRVLRQPTGLDGGTPARDGTRLADVPLRIRSASNPGGPHHAWVKARFVDPTTRHPDAVFMPSKLTDNPHINHDDYLRSLAELPLAERERLVNGNWQIPDDGELFQRNWITLIEPHQVPDRTLALRYWDLAATAPSAANPDPDWTVGLKLELEPRSGIYYITDIVRVRKAAGAVERIVKETADRDGHDVSIRIEQDAGGAGKALTDRYTHHILRGYNVRADRVTGPKYLRAQPVAAAAENDLLRLVRTRQTDDFLDELSSFPHGHHDDCVDALAGAHHHVSKLPRHPATSHVPRGRIPTATEIAMRRSNYLLYPGRDPLEALAARLGARIWDSRDQQSSRGRL